MPSPLDDVCRAALPRASLPLLAPLRCEPGLRFALHEDDLWLSWDAANERILAALLPLSGVRLFAFRAGRWFPPGKHLPALDLPSGLDEQPLDRVLFPTPVNPIAAGQAPVQRVRLTLTPEGRPRPTTALLCLQKDLARWADSAPAPRLAALLGICRDQEVLVLGKNLPPIAGQRFWGQDVLMPLGYRPEPELPESAVRQALQVADEELALLTSDRVDVVPRAHLTPLSRAALKLTQLER